MFGKKKERLPEPPKRYRVDSIPLVALVKSKPANVVVEDILNAGNEKGWKLVNITHGTTNILVIWDTSPL